MSSRIFIDGAAREFGGNALTANQAGELQGVRHLYLRSGGEFVYIGGDTEVDLTGINSLRDYFSDRDDIVKIGALETSQATNTHGMFRRCSNLETVEWFNTSQVTRTRLMFQDCDALTEVPAWDFPQVTDTVQMFMNCESLETLPGFIFTKLDNATSMLLSCASLVSVPAWDFSTVTNMTAMFNGCISLETINITGIGTDFDVSDTALNKKGLEELFGNLSTVTGKTVTITGTPGADTADQSIATNKGWIVTG